MKHLMLVADEQGQRRELMDFDRGWAMETIERGSPVVPFWSEYASRTLRDRIHQLLP